MPLFRSSNIQFWPILEIVKNTTQSKPFTIGIFCGTSKPILLDKFLHDFINELVYLLKEDIEFDNKKYRLEVHSFVCDAPTKAYLKMIRSHGGYPRGGIPRVINVLNQAVMFEDYYEKSYYEKYFGLKTDR